ncbi:MAG: hypothetical protein AVDCRST_MAG68-1583 [uncultured Gemmatimonadetes bacterium]|uniref:Uncharacterized protein n=1 Tax=uncultured Gemmatimonadota bacterium TaxID=203437 RepID=A0A6J4KW24_9BACT|nr:MAG: hypothetical protein AVDCRST_MAG68-1583 [uncultured Gemmatimonadota bacterium]
MERGDLDGLVWSLGEPGRPLPGGSPDDEHDILGPTHGGAPTPLLSEAVQRALAREEPRLRRGTVEYLIA